jgi:hypothetical protein
MYSALEKFASLFTLSHYSFAILFLKYHYWLKSKFLSLKGRKISTWDVEAG